MEVYIQVPGGTKQAGWPPQPCPKMVLVGLHRIEILECKEYSGESGTIEHVDSFLVVGLQNVIYIFRPGDMDMVKY
jgi:hypothetical protein